MDKYGYYGIGVLFSYLLYVNTFLYFNWIGFVDTLLLIALLIRAYKNKL